MADNEQVELVRAYLQAVREAVQDIAFYARKSYVFDQVALGLLSKAFSISDAAFILIESEHAEEAYGLSRSLVECVLNLRYISEFEDPGTKESRALEFARFFFKEKQYWIYQAKQFIKDASVLADIEKYAADNNIIADPKPAKRHWSGEENFAWHCVGLIHPLDGQTHDLDSRKIDYAVDYHATSAYVHCTLEAIEHLLPSDQFVYAPATKPVGEGNQDQRTLYIIIQGIHAATRYAMFGMEMQKTQAIDQEYRRVMAAFKPIKRRRPETVYRRIF
jgi:hypothetical protein